VTIKLDIRVNVTDINGNWAAGKTHIDSALQTLKKGLMALLEILKAVARVIAKVASMLIEVVKKIIINMLKPVVEPLKKSIKRYVESVTSTLISILEIASKLLNRDVNEFKNSETLAEGVFIAIFESRQFKGLLLLGGVVQAIELFVSIQSKLSGIGEAAKQALSQLIVKLAESIENHWKKILIGFFFGGAGIKLILTLFDVSMTPEHEATLAFLATVITLLTQLMLSKYFKKTDKCMRDSLGVGDVLGLALAFTGWFIVVTSVAKEKHKKYALEINLFGLLLTALGLAIGLKMDSGIDEVDKVIGRFDEFISAGLLGYALIAFSAEVF